MYCIVALHFTLTRSYIFCLIPTPFTQFIWHVYTAVRRIFSYIPDDAVDRRKLGFFIRLDSSLRLSQNFNTREIFVYSAIAVKLARFENQRVPSNHWLASRGNEKSINRANYCDLSAFDNLSLIEVRYSLWVTQINAKERRISKINTVTREWWIYNVS